MKGILFSTAMVRAILDGRKKQTRRVIHLDISNWFDVCKVDGAIAWEDQETGDLYPPTYRARYQVGDILYVRETWTTECKMLQHVFDGKQIHYCADCKEDSTGLFAQCKWKKRPSIHMPKEAARIFLRITGVRVERIQQITYGDCCAEGVFKNEDLTNASYGQEATEKFSKLWDSINKKRGYGWETNPYVFVYAFERCEKQEET